MCVDLPLEVYISLVDCTVLFHSSFLYVVIRLEPHIVADSSALLLFSGYVALLLEVYITLFDHSMLLLSSPYVALLLEASVPLTDNFVPLLFSPLYVVLPLEVHPTH
ncbi:hypothetical protein DFP72DRAFT_908875 [Ephemerocybe angulata]|uniref:Uncharacterized protein n=1 Tax=Ephemerocybe angulata TaxID=980116 RepID=A0A8H6HPT2_9AGAR|nr:hypothetical protein DFP72DRAFT_908875 [Tulosesus angulatus]